MRHWMCRGGLEQPDKSPLHHLPPTIRFYPDRLDKSSLF